MLVKPLTKLKSIQQADPQVVNMSLFKVSIGDFLVDLDSCRGFLLKKLKYLENDFTAGDVGSWAKLSGTFFKPQKVFTVLELR